MAKYHVGVDLHKTVAQVCVLNEQGEPHAEWRAQLPDAEAGAKLLADLSAYASPSRIAVEALGCNRWFVNGCRAAGLDVIVVHAAAYQRERGAEGDGQIHRFFQAGGMASRRIRSRCAASRRGFSSGPIYRKDRPV